MSRSIYIEWFDLRFQIGFAVTQEDGSRKAYRFTLTEQVPKEIADAIKGEYAEKEKASA
jgi:hypothetical protein